MNRFSILQAIVRAAPWRPLTLVLFALLISALLVSCASLEQNSTPAASLPSLPNKKQVRVAQYVFITDVDLKRDHPLLLELEGLQEQMTQELKLPPCPHVVQVYLFNDRPNYDRYMQAHFRNLPSRRAFFMARGNERGGEELVVYTYWGDRIQEDLRHELTHALLHGVLKNVPMWLDEGLAEYFEVPPESRGLNYRHLSALRSQPGIPWSPDLARLEKLTLVKDMGPADYRESWAWVHFMLNTSPQAKAVLTNYLQQLRVSKDPGPFEPQLSDVVPTLENALRRHVAILEASTRKLPPH